MNHVCAILDMEMFTHGHQSWIREIGWIRVPAMGDVINFQVNPKNLPLWDEASRRTFAFIRNCIHGLDYYPRSGETTIFEESVPSIICALYQKCKSQDMDMVAYKGGIHEQNLLKSLGIPCYNLEEIEGCPAYHKQESVFPDCGNHHRYKYGHLHCASAEVSFYANWIDSLKQKSLSPVMGDRQPYPFLYLISTELVRTIVYPPTENESRRE